MYQANEKAIENAAKQFKAALEEMGYSGVVILYCYAKGVEGGDRIVTGYQADGYIQALGANTLIGKEILHNEFFDAD